jgi:aryl-alcohol dehydrogenase-like predicted oxidoreductase
LEKDYLPIFNDYKMGTTIWSPLAAGLLSGKYIEGVPADSRANLPGYEWLRKIMIETDNSKDRMQKIIDLKVIADELGVSLARMSIAWCLLNQNVSTVILGASKISQLEDNLGSMEVLKLLTPEVEKRIRAIID